MWIDSPRCLVSLLYHTLNTSYRAAEGEDGKKSHERARITQNFVVPGNKLKSLRREEYTPRYRADHRERQGRLHAKLVVAVHLAADDEPNDHPLGVNQAR